ncbi:MAG: helix-turn-helix domain-containing protein [Bdellovibrionales bacterium]|nr:helix-turn-helix domain-containing protein [Bdellovibrionales bacterium]
MKININQEEQKLRLLTRGNAAQLSKSKRKARLKKAGKMVVSRSDNSDGFIDNLIDVENVAEVLGVAPKTIRKWVCIRFIPFVRIGRRVMFRPKSIELWLNRKEEKPCQ